MTSPDRPEGWAGDPWDVVPVSFSALTASALLFSGRTRLFGWSFQETTGAAGAQLSLYDGDGAGGQLIAAITLTSNESTRDLIPHPGLTVKNGLAVVVGTGSVLGAVWVRQE